MGVIKSEETKLNEAVRARILGVFNNDGATGAIRGMLYNNLQQWKMKLTELNHYAAVIEAQNQGKVPKAFDTGDVYNFMKLTDKEREFILQELSGINDVSDEFLVKYAEKTLEKLKLVKSLSPAQKNLKDDLQEALTGVPFGD